MQMVTFADQKLREYRCGPNAGTPISVAASGNTTLSGTFDVPIDEMNQVICAGGAFSVDDARLTVTGAYLSIQNQSAGLIQPVPGGGVNTFVQFGTNVPVSVVNLVATLRTAFAVSLQGVVLMGGDAVTVVMNVNNSDAVTAHNITNFGFTCRVLPFKVVSEAAVQLVGNQRTDAFLNQRLLQRR